MRTARSDDATWADGVQKRILVYALTVARSGGCLEDLLQMMVGMVGRRPPIDSAVATLTRGRGDDDARRAVKLLRLSLATGLFPD